MRAAGTQLEPEDVNTQLTDSTETLSTENIFKFPLFGVDLINLHCAI